MVDAPPGTAALTEGPGDAEALRACMRDLLGLLPLPALWRERDQRGVLQGLFEALETVLPISFGCARIHETVYGNDAVRFCRAGGRHVDIDDPEWGAIIDACDDPACANADSPAGPLTLVHVPLGFRGAQGHLVVGSLVPGFPSQRDTVLLRAAATLGEAGLENAALLKERDEASRAKDEFLAMLGHELRNPLAPIVTAVRLLHQKNLYQDSREIAVIERQVKSLQRLVDDLMDVARVTRGKITLKRERVEVARCWPRRSRRRPLRSSTQNTAW